MIGNIKDTFTNAEISAANTGKSIGEIKNGVTSIASDIADSAINGIANIKDTLSSFANATDASSWISALSGLSSNEPAYLPATPFYSVGHRETIKMEYLIGIGSISSGFMEKVLAYTESFNEGVSLSDIKWGFYNTGAGGATEAGYIEFTIHDIAGQCLEDFVKIKSATQYIYFQGPMSDGSLWPGPQMIYSPLSEDCNLEFSPSQGFTYTFKGFPLFQAARSKVMGAPAQFIINGLDHTTNKPHSNTFEDYLKELADKWNANIQSETKKNIAGIKFEYETGDNIDSMRKATPFNVIKEKGKTLSTTANPLTPAAPITVQAGDTLSDVVIKLWQHGFAPTEQDAAGGYNADSKVEVNLKAKDGNIHLIDVKLHEKLKTDTTTTLIPVCVGDDINCKYQPYRANLVGINFGGIWNVVAANLFSKTEGGTDESDPSVTAGNDTKKNTDINVQDATTGTTAGSKENMNAIDTNPGIRSGQNPVYDGWNTVATILNKHKMPDFELNIELPYSFGFTPMVHGGLLTDSMTGMATGGISFKQGVALMFYWYTSPTCSALALVPGISNDYRVVKVTHNIGLNGNTTQVALSHLTIT